jgi:hypothetical protein
VFSWGKDDPMLDDDSDYVTRELRIMHGSQLDSLGLRILHEVHFEARDAHLNSKESAILPWMTISSLHLHLLHYMLHRRGTVSLADLDSSNVRSALKAILSAHPRAILPDEDTCQIVHNPNIFDHVGHAAIWDRKLLSNVQDRVKMIDWKGLGSCDEDAVEDLQSVTSLLASTSKQFSMVGDRHTEIQDISETLHSSIQVLKNRCEKLRSTYVSLSIGKCKQQKKK